MLGGWRKEKGTKLLTIGTYYSADVASITHLSLFTVKTEHGVTVVVQRKTSKFTLVSAIDIQMGNISGVKNNSHSVTFM